MPFGVRVSSIRLTAIPSKALDGVTCNGLVVGNLQPRLTLTLLFDLELSGHRVHFLGVPFVPKREVLDRRLPGARGEGHP